MKQYGYVLRNSAKTVIFLRNNAKLEKKSRLLCEIGNLSQKQYEISKKSRLLCEISNLSEKQCEIGKKSRLLCENGNLSEKQYEKEREKQTSSQSI